MNYIKLKKELQLHYINESIVNLVEIIKDTTFDLAYDLPYTHYILELRALNFEYIRQSGKTTVLCELFKRSNKTLYVCHSRHMRKHICDQLKLGYDTDKVITADSASIRDPRLKSIRFEFDQILFDECFSKELFVNVVQKYELDKTDNRDMIVVAMGSPAI